jgi:hypothetical protein
MKREAGQTLLTGINSEEERYERSGEESRIRE